MKYQNANMLRITSICLTILFLGLMSASFAHAEKYSLVTQWSTNTTSTNSSYNDDPVGVAVDARLSEKVA